MTRANTIYQALVARPVPSEFTMDTAPVMRRVQTAASPSSLYRQVMAGFTGRTGQTGGRPGLARRTKGTVTWQLAGSPGLRARHRRSRCSASARFAIILAGMIVAAIPYRGYAGEGYSPLNHFISELGEIAASRLAWAFNLGIVLGGVGLGAFLLLAARAADRRFRTALVGRRSSPECRGPSSASSQWTTCRPTGSSPRSSSSPAGSLAGIFSALAPVVAQIRVSALAAGPRRWPWS